MNDIRALSSSTSAMRVALMAAGRCESRLSAVRGALLEENKPPSGQGLMVDEFVQTLRDQSVNDMVAKQARQTRG